jgi:hypothetical protein
MSTSINPFPDPSSSEDLVAYLDGELPPEECRRIEDRLAVDDTFRQQLRDLDQAWEALAALPKTSVDDNFARTTIELAAVEANDDLSQVSSTAAAQTRRQTKWWILSAVAAVAFGFFVSRALVPDRNEALVNDLPAIEQVNALSFVSDMDFLRGLSTLRSDQWTKDDGALERELKRFQTTVAASPAERRQSIQNLSSEEKAELTVRAKYFHELKPPRQEQERMRNLIDQIARADDKAKLQATLVAFGEWLAHKSSGEQQQLREDLRDRSTPEKVDHVRQLVRQEDMEASRHLSDEDAATLRKEIINIAKERHPELARQLAMKAENASLPHAEELRVRQVLFMLRGELMNKDATPSETLDQVINRLSPRARAIWGFVNRRQELRQKQLAIWLRDAMRPKGGPEVLADFFSDKLSNDVRQQLLELPWPEMENRLEQMYLASELGYGDAEQLLRGRGEAGRGPRNPLGGIGRRLDGSPPDERGRPGPPRPDFRGDRKGGPPRDDIQPDRPRGPGERRGPEPEDRRRPNPPPQPPPNAPPRDDQHETI